MKFGRFVPHVNTHRLTESDFGVTSYFQDGGHDVISRRKKSAVIWLFEEHRPNNNNNSKMSSDMGPVADQKDLVIRHAHDILSHATSR